MKNLLRFFGLFSLLIVLAASVSAQTGKTYYDNFSVARDYLTDGVTGTIWDGLKVNNGFLTVTTEAQLTKLNTKDAAGSLTFSTINSYFAGDNDNGAFLYKNVAADVDFTVTMKMVGGDWPSLGGDTIPYLMAGALVRRADTISFLATQDFDQYSVGMDLRSIPGTLSSTGQEENWTGTNDDGDDLTVKSFPWVKLTKTGTTFTASCSADSVTWFDYQVNERPDLKGHALQVGLYNATYTDKEGTAIFDNFTLVEKGATSGVKTITRNSDNFKVYSVNNRIVISGSEAIGDVRIVSITGATIFEKRNINAYSVEIPVSKSAIYIAVVCSSNQTYARKVYVK